MTTHYYYTLHLKKVKKPGATRSLGVPAWRWQGINQTRTGTPHENDTCSLSILFSDRFTGSW